MSDPHKLFNYFLQSFSKEYEKSLEGFSTEEQIHLTDTLLAMMECYSKKRIDFDKVQKLQEELYKKYGSRLVNYSNLNLTEYFAEESLKHIDLQYEMKAKNIITGKTFTKTQREQFLTRAEILLNNYKRMLYLSAEPATGNKEEEIEKGVPLKTKGRPRREPDDNFTLLNQEQTALLITYLQEAKIIFKGSYLTNKQAGEAFSVLTGYSADTLRQTLSKTELERVRNKKNLTVVHSAFTRAIAVIENELRDMKKTS